ncbi:hypothetical protein TNCV_877221 [Trichonephila clavipes]|nr:hypothetical protein TNCV_877221 [Trichonephila clavipes]
MDFTEINSRGKRGELLERIDRQNSRFRTAKTTIIKFGLHASFVELESAKSALNESHHTHHGGAPHSLKNADLHVSEYVLIKYAKKKSPYSPDRWFRTVFQRSPVAYTTSKTDR